ncbi:MAG: hypothetical protein AAB601_00200 [Patescibacteria group bacterium]
MARAHSRSPLGKTDEDIILDDGLSEGEGEESVTPPLQESSDELPLDPEPEEEGGE